MLTGACGAGSRYAWSFLEAVARVVWSEMDTDASASADRLTYSAPWPVYGVSLARRRVCGMFWACLFGAWSSLGWFCILFLLMAFLGS